LILVTIAGVKAQDVFTSFSARIGNLSVNYNNSQVSDLLYQHYGVPVNTLNSLYNSYDRNWGDVTNPPCQKKKRIGREFIGIIQLTEIRI